MKGSNHRERSSLWRRSCANSPCSCEAPPSKIILDRYSECKEKLEKRRLLSQAEKEAEKACQALAAPEVRHAPHQQVAQVERQGRGVIQNVNCVCRIVSKYYTLDTDSAVLHSYCVSLGLACVAFRAEDLNVFTYSMQHGMHRLVRQHACPQGSLVLTGV